MGDAGEKRKKKKSYYAKLKRQEDDKMAELAAKYRDRAKERRDGGPGSERWVCLFSAPKIVLTTLGMILENKVVQKLKLEKNIFYKKWSPKLIFLNDFFLKKFRRFLT